MNVQPLRDFVAVVKDEGPKQTPGGLYVPTTVEDKIVTGTVVAVGSGHFTPKGMSVPLEVTVGDKVVFNKNLAVEVKQDGESVSILREDQILCILK